MEYVQQVMDQMPPRYFTSFPPPRREKHAEALGNLGEDGLSAVFVELESAGQEAQACARVTVIAFDVPGLFAVLTGTMAVFGCEIYSGLSCTAVPQSAGGYRPLSDQRRRIIDEFTGAVPQNIEAGIWRAQLESSLQQAVDRFTGGSQQDVLELRRELAQSVADILAKQTSVAGTVLPPITTDVKSDDEGTRIALTSTDTPFFLYSAAGALSLHGVSIEGVEIKTSNGMVEDVFELVDAFGRPIQRQELIDHLRFSLVFTKQFTYHLAAAPDPFSALQRFDQLMQDIMKVGIDGDGDSDMKDSLTDPAIQQELAKLLGASDFLWEEFIRQQHEQILPVLSREARGRVLSLDEARVGLELDSAINKVESYEAKVKALNDFKDREIFHIDIDHILHPDLDFFFLSRRLVRLAEEVIRAAMELAWDMLAARHGVPRTAGGMAVPWAVFGLGKLGGEALGYASDLEVLCIYADAGRTDGEKSISNREFFEKLFSTGLRAIKARKEGIFQIDLRLRPFGEDGPLACNLDSFVSYYQRGGSAHSYERLALIRLRYVAGDPVLGERVERLRDELIYQSDSIDLKEIREMRQKQLVHKSDDERFNAKFSPGALVDLEYNVQILQVEYAGDYPQLRTPRLHEALNGLRKAGALQNEEVQMLIDAYRFFRHLINGLRMLRGNALDLFLPDKGAVEFAHLARRMGYASGAISAADALYVDIQQYSAEVRSIIEKHLGRGAIPGSFTGNVLDVLLRKEGAAAEAQEFFARHGFREPQKAWAGMKYLHEVCEPCFRRIVVLAFEVLKDQPDHDLALLHWTQLVERVDARAHYRTLAKQPKRMEILFGLFGVSRFLSDILLQHPEFFDWVTEPATVANVRALDDLLQDVRGMIAQGNEHGISPRNVLRVFRKREMVRIGTRDLQIAVPLKYTLEEISSLAQAVVMTALEEVWKQQAEKAGDSAGAGRATPEKFCILAFGKFGGEELNYSSDIDLLAIYEPAGEQRDQNEIKQYTSVVRGLVAELNEYTSEGYAYRVDLRLRPFGASGDVAWSVPRIVEYYRKDASLWEFQALIKLRPIAGNLDLGADFLRQVRQIMAGTCSDKAVIDSIRQLREEAVQQYRSKELRLQPSQASPVNSLPEKLKEALAELPATDIKNGIGGIRDIEFLVQGLQMMHCGSATEVLHGGTLEALRRLAKKQALDQTDAVELAEYYVFLRRIEHLLQIFEDRQVHGLPLDERSLSRLARKALGPKSDAAELVRHIATQMRNVRRLYETFLQKCS